MADIMRIICVDEFSAKKFSLFLNVLYALYFVVYFGLLGINWRIPIENAARRCSTILALFSTMNLCKCVLTVCTAFSSLWCDACQVLSTAQKTSLSRRAFDYCFSVFSGNFSRTSYIMSLPTAYTSVVLYFVLCCEDAAVWTLEMTAFVRLFMLIFWLLLATANLVLRQSYTFDLTLGAVLGFYASFISSMALLTVEKMGCREWKKIVKTLMMPTLNA